MIVNVLMHTCAIN